VRSLYAGTSGLFEVEISGTAGFSILFTDAAHLLNFLPAVGTAAALGADEINPTTTTSGFFGGDVVALRLAVDFSDAGLLVQDSGLNFGDQVVCGLATDTDLNGTAVRDVLGIIETALGGGVTTDGVADVSSIATSLDVSFGSGTVSTGAQDHLQPGACP
jgi:hypothetical protein